MRIYTCKYANPKSIELNEVDPPDHLRLIEALTCKRSHIKQLKASTTDQTQLDKLQDEMDAYERLISRFTI